MARQTPLLTLLLAAVAAATAASAAGVADADADAAAALVKEGVKADVDALAATLAAKLSKGPQAGLIDANTPATVTTAPNGTTSVKCGRSRQCIDRSGPLTFGAVAEVTLTVTQSATPWTDTATNTMDLALIPYVPGARPATAIDAAGSVFSITKKGKDRVIVGNGLPSTPIGLFPVPNNTEAYTYYSALPGGIDPNTGQEYQPNGTADEIYVDTYNLTSTIPAFPIPSGYYPIDSLIVGITLTGAVWHIEYASDADGVWYNPTNVLPLDNCQGHPFANQYHLHGGFSWRCFKDQFTTTKGHSPLAGYALDGFGIFGPRDVDGKMITNAELDKCHGHFGPIEWEGKPTVMYHYHLNREYPYSIGCFRGSVDYFSALGSDAMRENLPLYSRSRAATKLRNVRAELQGAVGVPVNETSPKVAELGGLLTAAAAAVELKWNGTA